MGVKYQLLLISNDGEDYVTDCNNSTKEEVEDFLENMGSRWIFYPYRFLIYDKGPYLSPQQRILENYSGIENLKGYGIKRTMLVIRWLLNSI